MMHKYNKAVLAAACTAALGSVSVPTQAANWTMLQGTEPANAAPRAKVWGFVDFQYQKDNSSANPYVGTKGNNYEYVAPELIGPDLDSQSGFNVSRARIGVRGQGFPLDGNVNYFVLAEMGNNGITHGDGSSVKLTDASITLNHIKGARIRVGAFKTPTFEEGYQAIHVFDYINFTEVANQMMLERYPNHKWTANRNNTAGFLYTNDNGASPYNLFNQPVGAFRDVGIQVFDAFRNQDWEHTYAIMVGNGNGVNFADNDDNKDIHVYWSSEKIFGGSGPFREGLKIFAWGEKGKRTLYNPATPAANDSEPGGKQEYDRKRYGLGAKFVKGNWRATAEYLRGEGMIFLGPDNPTFTITAPPNNTADGGGGVGVAGVTEAVISDQTAALLADGRNGKADGWYIEGGYKIPGTNWEVDARYDVYNRLTNAVKLAGPCAFEFQFKTITLGAQYHFNKKTRLQFNVADRNFEAVDCPAPAPGGNPNNNLDGVDKRYAIQLRHVF